MRRRGCCCDEKGREDAEELRRRGCCCDEEERKLL
jgi:hypothetical protein